MSCTTRRDICIVRGDLFEENLGFSDDYAEMVEDPTQYQVNMVFREYQDDTLTPFLTLSAIPEASTDESVNAYPVVCSLEANGTETASLPDYNHFYYVELLKSGDDGGTRLYEGKVKIGD